MHIDPAPANSLALRQAPRAKHPSGERLSQGRDRSDVSGRAPMDGTVRRIGTARLSQTLPIHISDES